MAFDFTKLEILPWHPFHWGFQMTQPLLFDDCFSLLQKIMMLYQKLQELIDDYNQFKEDFEAWKAEVEEAIDELKEAVSELDERLTTAEANIETLQSDLTTLQQTVSTLSNDLTTLQQTVSTISNDLTTLEQTVSNISNTVSNLSSDVSTNTADITTIKNWITAHESDFSTLAERVTNLENCCSTVQSDIAEIKASLAALDVQLPTTLISTDSFAALQTAWYDWIADYCDSAAGNTSGTFKSYLSLTLREIPGVSDQPNPARRLIVGKVGTPIIICKLPLALSASISYTTEAQAVAAALAVMQAAGLDEFFKNAITSANPYFTATAETAYPYTLVSGNSTTIRSSHIPFLYGAAAAGDVNNLYRVDWDYTGATTVSKATVIETDVRLQLTENSTTLKLAVTSNGLYFAIYNGEVIFYFVTDND